MSFLTAARIVRRSVRIANEHGNWERMMKRPEAEWRQLARAGCDRAGMIGASCRECGSVLETSDGTVAACPEHPHEAATHREILRALFGNRKIPLPEVSEDVYV